MLINTGNISRKVLSKVLRSFVKNFERLQYSSAKVHRSLKISANTELPKCFEDYSITVEALDGLAPEVIEGV